MVRFSSSTVSSLLASSSAIKVAAVAAAATTVAVTAKRPPQTDTAAAAAATRRLFWNTKNHDKRRSKEQKAMKQQQHRRRRFLAAAAAAANHHRSLSQDSFSQDDYSSFSQDEKENHIATTTTTTLTNSFRGTAKMNTVVNRQQQQKQQECDPDVGILSCTIMMTMMMTTHGNSNHKNKDNNQYVCQEDPNSRLGGFCVPKPPQPPPATATRSILPLRALLTYGDDDATIPGSIGTTTETPPLFSELACSTEPIAGYPVDYSEFCDCSEFDLPSSVGTIRCVLPDVYCEYGCRVETCATTNIVYNTPVTVAGQEEELTKIEWCYNFYTPYVQTLCTTYYQPVGTYSYAAAGPCTITLDGQECNSCQVLEGGCVLFDCNNVGAGYNLGGACPSNETTAVYPTYPYMPPPVPPPSYGSSGTTTTTTDGTSINQVTTNSSNTNSSYPIAPIVANCNAVAPVVGNCSTLCGAEDGSSSSSWITASKYNVTVSFPWIGNVTCGTIATLEGQGRIYDVACDYVSTYTVNACCEPQFPPAR